MKNLWFLPIVVLAFLCLSCSAKNQLDKADYVSETSRELCSNLKNNRELCRQVVSRRQQELEAKVIYLTGQNKKHSLINSRNKDKKQLPIHNINASAKQAIGDIETTVQIFLNTKPILTKWICRNGFSTGIRCIKTADLIAMSDNEMAKAVIKDLLDLEMRYKVKPDSTLFDCGYGQWSSLQSFSETQPIDLGNEAKLSFACAERIQALRDELSGESPQGGLDPIAPSLGASPFDPSDVLCNLGPGEVQSTGSFIEATIGAVESLRLSCFGDSTAPLSTGPYSGMPSSALPFPDPDYYEQLHEFDSAVEGLKEAAEQKAINGRNRDGTRTKTWESSGGTVRETYSKNGRKKLRTEVSIPNADGSTTTITVDYRNDTITYEHMSGSGSFQQVFTQDGSGLYADSNGNVIETDSAGNLVSWSIDGSVICGNDNNPCPSSSCNDPDFCSSCDSAVSNIPKSLADCAFLGNQSAQCQSFLASNECCSSRVSNPSDPHVVMPHPEGNSYSCIPASWDSKDELCRIKCSLQTCYDTCMEGQAYSQPSVVDEACQYMISEECFGGGGLELPPLDGGPGPLPAPFTFNGSIFLTYKDRL
jgi:hypothetical protein